MIIKRQQNLDEKSFNRMWKIKGLPERKLPSFTPRQRDALLASLPKWQRLAWMPEGLEHEPECSCCSKWYYTRPCSYCVGCPIADFTQDTTCHGTPYYSWSNSFEYCPDESLFEYLSDESKRLAEEELQFLEGLYDIAAHNQRVP